jgi:hypothetical protein
LIDAAWRLEPRLLDACLAEVPLPVAPAAGDGGPSASPRRGGELRLRLDVVFDGTGRVRSATVEPAAVVPAGVASCIETALTTRLRPPPPARKKVTRARIELVLAPAESSGV